MPSRPKPLRRGGRGVRVAAPGGLCARGSCRRTSQWRRWPTSPPAAATWQLRCAMCGRSSRPARRRSTWCCPGARCATVTTAAAEDLLRAVRRACEGLRLKVILESGELQDDALVARACRAGAGLRRRFPQDQHRQDARRCHAGRGAGDAAGHRRPPAGTRPRRAQGVGRHPPRGRCVALHRAVPQPLAMPLAAARCASAATFSHRCQQPARRHRGRARRHGRAAGRPAATDEHAGAGNHPHQARRRRARRRRRSTPSSTAWSMARGARARPRRWRWRCSSTACHATRPSR